MVGVENLRKEEEKEEEKDKVNKGREKITKGNGSRRRRRMDRGEKMRRIKTMELIGGSFL